MTDIVRVYHDALALRALLVAARAEIADPARHIRGAGARNQYGYETCPKAPDARTFCGWGAVFKHDPDATDEGLGTLGQIAMSLLDRVAMKLGHPHRRQAPSVSLNDLGSHRDVVRMFMWAILLAGHPKRQSRLDPPSFRRRFRANSSDTFFDFQQ